MNDSPLSSLYNHITEISDDIKFYKNIVNYLEVLRILGSKKFAVSFFFLLVLKKIPPRTVIVLMVVVFHSAS